MTYFFTINSCGIGQGLSDSIISSFKIFVGVHLRTLAESVKFGCPLKSSIRVFVSPWLT